MEKMKGVAITIALWATLLLLAGGLVVSTAQANVTMDVDKWNGPSGTYVCKDEKTCWMLYRAAEFRGDMYYCNSVVIKRDGRVVWFRNFYKNESIID